jgi:hypothetical protein
MKARYASMPDWLYRFLRITKKQDQGPFRMHDHDYGNVGYTINGWDRAKNRAQADRNLHYRLIEYGVRPDKAFLIWAGSRLFLWWKWRRS